jgi:hypothetical protein
MPRFPRLFFLSFGVWLGILVLAQTMKHSSVGRVGFASPAAWTAYVGIQGALTGIAFILGGWSLMRGPNRTRWVAALPMIVLAVYGAVLIAGK